MLLVHRLVRRSASEVGILDEARIRVKPVSVSQCQKSPCQLVSMLIHRLRQPARSKEQGNSFAGGQGADFHSPCTPGRERTATSTPSRLTFAVNKIRVNPWLSCLKSLCICSFCAFESLWPILSFALRPSLFAPPPKVKKCKKSVQNMLKTCSFLLIIANKCK